MKKFMNGLRVAGTILAGSISVALNPGVSEAQNLGNYYAPNQEVMRLAQAVKAAPASSRSVSDRNGVFSVLYERELRLNDGLNCSILYIDKSFGLNKYSNSSDGRIGRGDILTIQCSNGMWFRDVDLDGRIELGNFGPQNNGFGNHKPKIGENTGNFYLRNVGEALEAIKGER